MLRKFRLVLNSGSDCQRIERIDFGISEACVRWYVGTTTLGQVMPRIELALAGISDQTIFEAILRIAFVEHVLEGGLQFGGRECGCRIKGLLVRKALHHYLAPAQRRGTGQDTVEVLGVPRRFHVSFTAAGRAAIEVAIVCGAPIVLG